MQHANYCHLEHTVSHHVSTGSKFIHVQVQVQVMELNKWIYSSMEKYKYQSPKAH